MKNNTNAFTLVEVIIAISIMSVVLVAIMGVFFSMSDLGNKTEIQRQLQSNIKNIVQTMSEDIAKHGISTGNCSVLGAEQGSFWCNKNSDRYYLGKKDDSGKFFVASLAECADIQNTCSILKNGTPMSNSFIAVRDLEFRIIGDDELPKLLLRGKFSPSTDKGVKPNLIKNNTFTLQTTLSETFLQQ